MEYLSKDWDRAETIYNQILGMYNNDEIAKIFIERIKKFKKSPPPDDWDGSYKFETK